MPIPNAAQGAAGLTNKDASDTDLVRAFVGGDPSAFDELFRRYQPRIKAACVKLMGSAEAADDMVQETFYNVVRSAERIDETYNFSAWIHRVATNACTDELRRRQRRLKREVESASDDDDDIILRLPDPDASRQPEQALELERMRHLIWEVSKKLPERQRTVLALRELQSMPYASIARFLNISESAVETLLHRARRRFREEFLMMEGPSEDEGDCAVVMRLLTTVGRDKLQANQRRMVDEHLQVCSWCRENSEIALVRKESEKVRTADD